MTSLGFGLVEQSQGPHFTHLINSVDYRHALPIFHIPSGCLGSGSCTVPNVEPEFSRMPIFKSRAKNSSYEGWYADIDTAVILEINRLGRLIEVTTCSQLYVIDPD